MERFINYPAKQERMAFLDSKKGVKAEIWISVAFIAVVISGLFVYFYLEWQKPALPLYQNMPDTWIEEKGDVKEISVDKVTKGESFVDTNGQQYITKEIGTVFNYNGWYKGQAFRREFRDNSGKVLMRINQNMDPDDGVSEAFVIERIQKESNEDKLTTYVFLDEDWKINVPTKLYYGKRFENEKEFDFTKEIAKGIYMNELRDTPERFANNYATHYGGVIVGDFREDDKSTIVQFS